MKRQWKKALCLLIALAALSGCSPSPEEPAKVFAEVTQVLGPVADTPTPAPQAPDADGITGGDSVFNSNPYLLDDTEFSPEDAMGEEGYVDDGVYDPGTYDQGVDMYAYVDPNATKYPYAGSTPIPLDPVDMPSPTPRSEIVFMYVPYTISTLGLTFEGPGGWIPDESGNEVFTLTEPESQKKDGQLGIIKVYASPVNSDYTESNLKTEINQRLKDIGSTNYEVWSPSLTASRHLMGGKGIYANYSGTLANGIKVGGRIHSVSIDRVLYTIEIAYPLNYKDDYMNAFTKMRDTIKRQ